MSTKQIDGFRVLPMMFSEKSTAYHEIFFKEHIVRNQSADMPVERTLFALNIPPYVSLDNLKRIFAAAGSVTRIIFRKNDSVDNATSFKTAYIVFESPKGLLNALKLVKLEPLSTRENFIPCGVNKWAKEYNQNQIDPKVLEKRINEYMSDYDKRRPTKNKEEQVDDEGWIKVTKHSRKSGLTRKVHIKEKMKQKKELKNFYTFQIRESKMKQLANLRKKFEDDRRKINTLKQARKFKPF